MGYTFSESKEARVPLTEEQIRKILIKADTNQDNSLNVEELKKALANLGSYLPSTRAQIGMWQADDDGDGRIDLTTELDQLVNYARGLGLTITNKTTLFTA